VIQTVRYYCKTGNTINISVDGKDYLENADGIEEQVEPSKYYAKTIIRDTGAITKIRFTKIS
nr:hypothetical protein [Bacillota bacterium]